MSSGIIHRKRTISHEEQLKNLQCSNTSLQSIQKKYSRSGTKAKERDVKSTQKKQFLNSSKHNYRQPNYQQRQDFLEKQKEKQKEGQSLQPLKRYRKAQSQPYVFGPELLSFSKSNDNHHHFQRNSYSLNKECKRTLNNHFPQFYKRQKHSGVNTQEIKTRINHPQHQKQQVRSISHEVTPTANILKSVAAQQSLLLSQQSHFKNYKNSLTNIVDFSPYVDNKATDRNLATFHQHSCDQQQQLLADQIQGQYKLVKSQLAELEYQNELLKKKIMSQNDQIKVYVDESVANKQLIQQLRQIIDNNEFQRQRTDQLVIEMKEEISILLTKTRVLESEIQESRKLIQKISRKQLYHKSSEIEQERRRAKHYQNKRRSLDVTGSGFSRNHPHSHYFVNSQKENQISTLNEQFVRQNQCKSHEQSDFLQTTADGNHHNQYEFKRRPNRNVGKLFNKTMDLSSCQHSFATAQGNSKSCELRLIDSISNMFEKIHARRPDSLKEIWKWLKRCVHQIQDLKGLKGMLSLVLQDFKQTFDRDMSSMDQEFRRLLIKISNIIGEESSSLMD